MSSKRLSWLPWFLLMCLAGYCVVLLYQQFRLRLYYDDFRYRDEFRARAMDRIEARDVELKGRLAYLRTQDALPQIRLVLLTSETSDAPKATGAIAWDMGGHRGAITTANLPPPAADRDYQLWITQPGDAPPVSAGIIDTSKPAFEFQPAKPIDSAGQFTVTVELKGGSPSPHGPWVLHGK
ncbi:MAG TPA: anti-sigma factor [Chthoniobacteraceae bacterium]|jgi:hypothetical protein|nr:anti-sigma factor [Chthoniobacteraceae bacterium]